MITTTSTLEVQTVLEESNKLRVPVPDNVPTPVPGRHLSSLELKQFLCGCIASGVSSFLTSPLSKLQANIIAQRRGSSTQQQLQEAISSPHYRASLLSSSLFMPVLITALNKGIQFSTFELVKRRLRAFRKAQRGRLLASKHAPSSSSFSPHPTHTTNSSSSSRSSSDHPLSSLLSRLPASSIAGAVAGLSSTVLMYPLMAVGDHMALQPGKYRSLPHALISVASSFGVSQLFRGCGLKLLETVPSGAVNFYVYDSIKWRIKHGRSGREPSPIHHMLTGAIAGFAATTVTHPLELLRRETNLSLLPASATPTGGHQAMLTPWQVAVVLWREGGVRRFYRGVIPSLLQAVASAAVGFAVYEVSKRGMRAEGREREDDLKG